MSYICLNCCCCGHTLEPQQPPSLNICTPSHGVFPESFQERPVRDVSTPSSSCFSSLSALSTYLPIRHKGETNIRTCTNVRTDAVTVWTADVNNRVSSCSVGLGEGTLVALGNLHKITCTAQKKRSLTQSPLCRRCFFNTRRGKEVGWDIISGLNRRKI